MGSLKLGRLRRAGVVLGVTVASLMGFAGTAMADVVVEGTGVRGRGDWTWGYASLTDVSLGVRDTGCDGHRVYVHLRVYSKAGGYVDTVERYNPSSSCGTYYNWTDLRFDDGFYIAGVRVRACVDDWGTDTCYLSEYHDNPNT